MSLLSKLTESAEPRVAVEIASDHVSAASLELRGRQAVVSAHATEPLAPGAVVPSLTAANLVDRAAVIGALGRLFTRLGERPRRIGLVIPDLTSRVSLIRLEKVPARRDDLEQVVRFHVRKSAPFPIEEAQLSFVQGARHDDGHEFIVSLARRQVVEEYEGVCAELGAHAGVVDIATFNVINAVLAGDAAANARGDWLLVNVAGDHASIAIVRGEHLIFFRNRGGESEGTLADLVHQTAMYYEDRLTGAGFTRVILASSGPPAETEDIRRNLAERLRINVDSLDPRTAAALTDRISAAPRLLDTLAPLVGLLLRGRKAAA
jgi:Tfp pilus assembly PilM family ATPase